MKHLKVVGLMVLAAVLLASCSVTDMFNSEPADIEKDLMKLQSYITGVETGLNLLKDTDNTITPKTVNPVYISEILNKTPQTVYTEANGTTGAVRIPSSGNFADPYGNGLVEAYMTLEPVDSTIYKVTFYITPKGNTLVDYSKEVYYVGKDDTSWSILNSQGQPAYGILTEWVTYFTDNSEEDRTVVWTSLSNNSTYSTFSVPALTDQAYVYDGHTVPVASGTNTAEYSSKSTFTFNPGKEKWYTITGTEYYTEDNSSGEEIRSSFTTAEKGHKNNTADRLTKSVTRYQENITQGTKLVRSLSYTSWNNSVANAWVVYTTDLNMSKTADGKITYTNVDTVTWTSSITLVEGGINLEYSQKFTYNLTETAVGSNNFTGTLDKDWGWGNIGVYDVTITDGKYKEKWSSSKSTMEGTPELAIDLTTLGQDLTITVPGGNGSFTGSYEQGSFSGTYTYKGTAYQVIVSKDIIWIQSGDVWKYYNKDHWETYTE